MKRISTAALTDHNRSCVPCALSVILNKPYEEVNNWLKYRGYRRSDNRGTYTDRMRLSELNLIKMSIDPISVNRFAEKYSQGTYFVLVRQHGLAVKNGICYDTIISEKKRVQEAYELQGGVRLPHDWDSAQRDFQAKIQYIEQKKKKELQEKKRKEYYKKIKKTIKAKKNTAEYKLDQLLKRKKSWISKLKRAQATLKTIERKIKYYQRKNTQS